VDETRNWFTCSPYLGRLLQPFLVPSIDDVPHTRVCPQ
jgi:hypothetical protein